MKKSKKGQILLLAHNIRNHINKKKIKSRMILIKKIFERLLIILWIKSKYQKVKAYIVKYKPKL